MGRIKEGGQGSVKEVGRKDNSREVGMLPVQRDKAKTP